VELVLIRHTRTSAPAGTCYGHLDVALSDTHVQDIAVALAGIAKADAVFTSPSQRCALLARSLAQRDSCALTIAAELRELNFGDWEGRLWSEIPRSESDHWAADTWKHAPPGGETEQALWDRVERWWRLLPLPQCERIVIVAHGGSLRVLRCLLLRLASQHRWEWQIDFGQSFPVGLHSIAVDGRQVSQHPSLRATSSPSGD
jgi:alpha-ribazole phosphatase